MIWENEDGSIDMPVFVFVAICMAAMAVTFVCYCAAAVLVELGF